MDRVLLCATWIEVRRRQSAIEPPTSSAITPSETSTGILTLQALGIGLPQFVDELSNCPALIRRFDEGTLKPPARQPP